jgi:hypothetical protein
MTCSFEPPDPMTSSACRAGNASRVDAQQGTFYHPDEYRTLRRTTPLSLEQNMNILTRQHGDATMLKRLVLTGLVEFMAFGMLFAAVGAWAIALAPVR